MAYMFSYRLPDGAPNDLVTIDATGNLKFEPPVYEQRYSTTIRILEDPRWSAHFQKIVDFGCSEMRLLRLLRRLESVEHIMEVDIDETTLLIYQSRAAPLLADNLKQRDRPLRIEVFKGSITDSVENLRNVDAVIALEVIEHLMPDLLAKVPANIFGYIQPKLVIVSTPNQEYNVLFNGLNANGFRIDDHKFEWTRKEFKNWATEICKKYPNYSFATMGVGSAPPDHKKLGHVTQIAIFARNDIIGRPLAGPIKTDLEADKRPEVQYKEIFAVDFPFRIDARSKEQKIKDEIMSYIDYAHKIDRYYNRERYIYQIPIKYLIEYAKTIDATEEDVLKQLKDLNFVVENEFICLTDEYIEENYHTRGDDLYEEYDEDFLDFEPYRGAESDEDISNAMRRSCSINDDQEEESWD